jgi:hypothetical protein
METDMTDLINAPAYSTIILSCLRDAAESYSIDSDGVRWGMVYLDNARPSSMSRRKFAGYLSALKAAELYVPTYDKNFGEVRMGA